MLELGLLCPHVTPLTLHVTPLLVVSDASHRCGRDVNSAYRAAHWIHTGDVTIHSNAMGLRCDGRLFAKQPSQQWTEVRPGSGGYV